MPGDGVVGGLHVPSDGLAEAVPLVDALVSSAERNGVRFRFGAEVAGVEADGSVRLVGGEVLRARRVVVALGIWGASLLRPLGAVLPLVPVEHPYVYTEDVPDGGPDDPPYVRFSGQHVYVRRHGERYGFGTYDHDPIPHAQDRFGLRDADAERPFSDAAFGPALARAQSLVPALRGRRIGRRLNGVYALTPDALPLAGPLPGLPRVWVAEGCWVTQAGGLGAQLARQLSGEGESLVDPARLDPGRFDGWDADRVRTAALRHYRGV